MSDLGGWIALATMFVLAIVAIWKWVTGPDHGPDPVVHSIYCACHRCHPWVSTTKRRKKVTHSVGCWCKRCRRG